MKKLLPALGLALGLGFVGCAGPVSASADGEGNLASDAEMSCCALSILAEKAECGDCGANVEGKVVCPASGTIYDTDADGNAITQ
jgi:hypothetical protein